MSADDPAEKTLTGVLMHATNASATHKLLSNFKAEYGADLLRLVAREVFAQTITEVPSGWSERYVAGWNDAVDAVVDKVRSMSLDSMPVDPDGELRCVCGCKKKDHQGPEGLGGAQCRQCPGDSERSWRHEFTFRDAS